MNALNAELKDCKRLVQLKRHFLHMLYKEALHQQKPVFSAKEPCTIKAEKKAFKTPVAKVVV